MQSADPITGGPPTEVPLERPPLVKVIAQIRFPMVTAIGRQEFIAPFQEAIRKTYPVLRPEKGQSIVLGPDGPAVLQEEMVWRFNNGESTWKVGLSPSFLSLETTAYSSRTEFMERLKEVVRALERHVEPTVVDRLGIRYINRITGDELKDISALIRSEVCGVVTALPNLEHSITQAAFKLGKNQLMARWGKLPPKQSPEPGLEIVNEESWILDFDMFTTETFAFDTKLLLSNSMMFTERIYSLFRWVVTEEFLRRRGGKV